CRSRPPCRSDWENSGRMPAWRALDRPVSAAPAAAGASRGSPCGARPPDRTTALAAARTRRKRGSRDQLRHVVIAVGARAQIEDGGDSTKSELAIEMGKQLVLARALQAQDVTARNGNARAPARPSRAETRQSRATAR